MRQLAILTMTVALFVFNAKEGLAERLELGLALGPIWLHNDDFNDFSIDDGALGTYGVDIRSEVGKVNGFEFVPNLGYRFSTADARAENYLNIDLNMHDFLFGLRIRKGVLPWMAVFAEPKVGVQYASMDARPISYHGYDGNNNLRYTDKLVTWSTGLFLGMEMYISRAWLRSKGVNRFCFGGELAGGYIRHGELSLDPTLKMKEDDAINGETLGEWGEINTSKWIMQIGLSFYFI